MPNWKELFPLFYTNVGRFGVINIGRTIEPRRCGLIHNSGERFRGNKLHFYTGIGVYVFLALPGLPLERAIKLGTLEVYDLSEYGLKEPAKCFDGYCPRADMDYIDFQGFNLCYCLRDGRMDTGVRTPVKRRFPFP